MRQPRNIKELSRRESSKTPEEISEFIARAEGYEVEELHPESQKALDSIIEGLSKEPKK